MFDFSFPEIAVILVVALIVVGPERLPKVARTLGHFWGRAQRYVNSVKSDIQRDMAVDEFRQLQQQVQAEASALEKSVGETSKKVDQQVQKVNEAVMKPLSPQGTSPATSAKAVQPPSQPKTPDKPE